MAGGPSCDIAGIQALADGPELVGQESGKAHDNFGADVLNQQTETAVLATNPSKAAI